MTEEGHAPIALLGKLIDHAPQFPPAARALPEAVAEDERARKSRHAFALGRYVCPASVLGELPDVGRGVSVVLDAPYDPDPRIEAVEARWEDWSGRLDELATLATEVYLEVPLGEGLPGRLDRLAEIGLCAKVRCGGASAPSAYALASFIRGCRERGLPFKATAGLHHALPVRGEHGLLNLLAAVVFGDEEEALVEQDRGAFSVNDKVFRWRDRAARPVEISRARRAQLRAIGSCSFFEPIAELEALGILRP